MSGQTEPRLIPKSQSLDGYSKGAIFEEYVIKLFNEKNFKLENWHRSQKIINVIDLIECSKPDLEFKFVRRGQYHFAVECKWRKKFINDGIWWATDKQIISYHNFQNKRRIPVFIVIGIGGEPSNPHQLFVTPLQNICSSIFVAKDKLIPYDRKPTRRFFYDTIQLKLF